MADVDEFGDLHTGLTTLVANQSALSDAALTLQPVEGHAVAVACARYLPPDVVVSVHMVIISSPHASTSSPLVKKMSLKLLNTLDR